MTIQNKMFLYYAQIHANQLKHRDNRKIAKTITINILDYKYFEGTAYHKKVLIKDRKKTIEGEIEIHVLELPKFRIENVNCLTDKEEWMLYFKEKNSKKIQSVINGALYIKKLDILLDDFWKSEKME